MANPEGGLGAAAPPSGQPTTAAPFLETELAPFLTNEIKIYIFNINIKQFQRMQKSYLEIYLEAVFEQIQHKILYVKHNKNPQCDFLKITTLFITFFCVFSLQQNCLLQNRNHTYWKYHVQ